MKVLFAIDEFPGPVAGTETQFLRLLNGLDSKVVEPGVLLLRRSIYLESHNSSLPSRVMNVSRLSSPMSLVKALLAAIWAKKQGYKLVHTFLNDTSLLLPWALRLVGIPVLISRRDEGFWYTRGNLRALRLNRYFVAGVIANSDAVASSVISQERYSPRKLSVIRNGIDINTTFPDRHLARKVLGLSEDAFVISVLANLRPLKRIDDVISAFSLVCAQYPQALLLVAGADRKGRNAESHQCELEQLTSELGLTQSVHFMGAVEDTASLIAASDVGVLCSETEGFSNSVMQYLTSGTPMICTRVGGNPEMVIDGQTGLLVTVGATEEIAQAMSEMIEKPERRAQMGASARALMLESFSLTTMLLAHEDLYRETAR